MPISTEKINSERTVEDRVIDGAMMLLSEGDGSNLDYYRKQLDKFVGNQLQENTVKLKDWTPELNNTWKAEFFRKLTDRIRQEMNKINEDKKSLSRQATLLEQKKKTLKNHNDNIRIFAMEHGLSLDIKEEKAEEVTEVEQLPEERGELTEDPTKFIDKSDISNYEITEEMKSWMPKILTISGKIKDIQSREIKMEEDKDEIDSIDDINHARLLLNQFLEINIDDVKTESLRREIQTLKEEIKITNLAEILKK